METSIVVKEGQIQTDSPLQRHHQPDHFLRVSGYTFVIVSAVCFCIIVYLQLHQSLGAELLPRSLTWLELAGQEAGPMSLLFIAVVAALLGKGLLVSAHMGSRTASPSRSTSTCGCAR